MDSVPSLLQDFLERPVYELDEGIDKDSGFQRYPWLVWNPPEVGPNSDQTEASSEVRFVKHFEERDPLSPWEPGTLEDALQVMYYGDLNEQGVMATTEAVLLCNQFGFSPTRPVPVDELHKIRALREEARLHLEEYVEDLRCEVMEPLRQVMIPCALEAARSKKQLGASASGPEAIGEELHESLRALFRVWKIGVGGGFFLEEIQKRWYEEAFQHVPEPVATGAKKAIERRYITSRNAIFEQARPAYFKWRAAKQMIGSALYEWVLTEELKQRQQPATSSDFDDLSASAANRYGTQKRVQKRRYTLRKMVDLSEKVSKKEKERLGERFNTSYHTINSDLRHLREEFVD